MPDKLWPPEPLLIGRRAIESIQGVSILQDWIWSETIRVWCLLCRFSLPVSAKSPIPPETDWYITVSENYPLGSIHIYPAKVGGISQTFHHQHNNADVYGQLPWRSGDICADHPLRSLERNPWYSTTLHPEDRLVTYINRATEWLVAASKNDLIRIGEPFELPDFSPDGDDVFAFAEDEFTFIRWKEIPDNCGLAAIASIQDSSFYVVRFDPLTTHRPILVNWGRELDDINKANEVGVWIRLKEIPVLPPWQAPVTLGELRKVCQSQHVDLDDIFQKTLPRIRDGKRHLLLIGFPIPVNHGEPASRMHWQALRLPILSYGKKARKGFRPNELGYIHRDMSEILRQDLRLDWLQSENWDSEQISTRGHLSSSLLEKTVLLVGAGALGSALAEILVREGVKDLTIIDPDVVQAGNLTRHTLTLLDLKTNKAHALASRLNLALPQSRVRSIQERFPPHEPNYQEIIKDSQVIIDSTGSDEVLYEFERFAWEEMKDFYSLSLGFGARRLFCFHSRSATFPTDTFAKVIRPWLILERDENIGVLMPMEGIGCWHPVFPARIDDIWMLASAGVKWIETSIRQDSTEDPELVVFEQIWENGNFNGLRKQRAE